MWVSVWMLYYYDVVGLLSFLVCSEVGYWFYMFVDVVWFWCILIFWELGFLLVDIGKLFGFFLEVECEVLGL